MKKIFIVVSIVSLILSCNSTEKKNTEDIKIGQAKAPEKPQTDLEKSIERGALIYKDFCNQCHRPKGKGVGRSFPPLAGSDYLFEKREESIRGVKYGQQGEIVVNGKTYNGVMLPMGLSDKEVADVMNYVMNSWGNKQEKMVTEAEVAAIEKKVD